MKPVGYREFPVHIVIEACNHYLENRSKRISREREDLIQKELSRKGSWFSKASETREDAIIKLKECADGEFFSDWNQVENTGCIPASRVENLLTLCVAKGGSDTVYITTDIGRLIF